MGRPERGIVSGHSSYYFCDNEDIHFDYLKNGTYEDALEKCGPAIKTPDICFDRIENELRIRNVSLNY